MISTVDRLSQRLRAVELLKQGKTVADIANEIGVSRVSIYAWKATLKEHGPEALSRPSKRKGRLSDEQVSCLLEAMKDPPHVHGLGNTKWSIMDVSILVHRLFGVDMNPEYLRKKLAKWRCQQ